MNQIETSIRYMPFHNENNFMNHNVFNEHKRNENKSTYTMHNQLYGTMIPESTKMCPITVTLFDENQINHSDDLISSDNSVNSPLETYQEVNLNQFHSIPRYTDKSLSSKNIKPNLPKQPSKPTTSTRSRWTKEEEDTLMELVKKAGPRKWNQIAAVLKSKTAKQCRDHYANCLDPEIRNSLWTDEEERLLLSKYQEYGPHWSRIKKFLPGRTTSIIKNYVTMLIKKNERGLSHELQTSHSSYQAPSIESEETSSSFISNPGSDTDDQNFTLNMTDVRVKYDNFNYLDINCLLNRPRIDFAVI